MIQWTSIQKYREQYPDDSCAYDAVGYGEVLITCNKTGVTYRSSLQETDDDFLDRLSRSLSENRNLFYEEWMSVEYKQDMVY